MNCYKRAYGLNDSCYRLLIFRYIFVISFGRYLAEKNNTINKWQYIISFVIGVGFIILHSYLRYESVIFKYWTATSVIACLYILPISAYLINYKKQIRCDLFEILGKASYNIFLVQMVYFGFFDTLIHEFVGGHMMLKLLFTVVINIAVGLLFYYIEVPVTKYIVERLKKYKDCNRNRNMEKRVNKESIGYYLLILCIGIYYYFFLGESGYIIERDSKTFLQANDFMLRNYFIYVGFLRLCLCLFGQELQLYMAFLIQSSIALIVSVIITEYFRKRFDLRYIEALFVYICTLLPYQNNRPLR